VVGGIRATTGLEYFGLTLQDISVFKRKFGGAELNLVPTLDYVYDSAAYRQYMATECDSDSETAN
jgi:hypothetical protein